MEKLKRRQFTAEFKIEAAKLVLDQGYSLAQAGDLVKFSLTALSVTDKWWKPF